MPLFTCLEGRELDHFRRGGGGGSERVGRKGSTIFAEA